MQYLTPQDLRKIAPAAQKMPQSDENLIDTKAFLRYLAKQGFSPIFATQGTPHVDAEEPLKSRHFVVSANEEGFAIALLNSHSVWRRAWIGAGFALPNREFMIGAAVPLQRWKGFEAPLATALAFKDKLVEARNALMLWTPNDFQNRWLAKQFAATAWLRGHKRPLSKAFFDGIQNETAFDGVNIMLTMARAGGLPPEPVNSVVPPRKLKPILAPDALLHASNAAFRVGLAGLKKYQGLDFDFPRYKNGK